jgi:hypothetical protein
MVELMFKVISTYLFLIYGGLELFLALVCSR